MSSELLGIIGLLVLIVLLCLKIPVAFVMILVGLFGAMVIVGPIVALKHWELLLSIPRIITSFLLYPFSFL